MNTNPTRDQQLSHIRAELLNRYHEEPSSLWAHFVYCWTLGFDYDEAIQGEHNFTKRCFTCERGYT